ncbi:MAG: glycosyltransferase family 4 protein, partial [Lachnospiraceae bacterium]|nr:glycosyltransferase family 4 protein [Lachnospiraceae bacterium]
IAALIQNVRACDEIWTVSRGAGENLRSLGYEGSYIVMENGVDLPRGRAAEAEIEKAVSEYNLPADVPVYLFVGRLMWYKGIRIILEALAKLKKQGSSFRMVFIGDGQDRQEISEYVAEKGLGKVCYFTGALSDRETLRAWYSRADLFLFPSTFDTNGLVVREAAACSLPSVLIEGSCAAEGVTDGRNGFLIKENAASMLAKLQELTERPETVKKVGECAAEELYLSWEESVGRAAARYETVLENFRCGKYPRKPGVRDLLSDIRSSQSTAKEKLIAAKTETRQRLQKGKETFWEYLDRYL